MISVWESSLFVLLLLILIVMYPLLFPFSLVILPLILLLFIVIFIINIMKAIKKNRKRIIYYSSLLIIVFVGFTYLPELCILQRIDYKLKQEPRQRIVGLIESNHLRGDQYGIVKLDGDLRHVSNNGSIKINWDNEILRVNFPIYQTWIDSFSGIIYSSDAKFPPKSILFWENSYIRFHRLGKNWFCYIHG